MRSSLAGNRIARLMFSFGDGKIIALHGFIKKTQKTPKAELEIAQRRQREFE